MMVKLLQINLCSWLFSSPAGSPGRAIVLPPASESALASAAALAK